MLHNKGSGCLHMPGCGRATLCAADPPDSEQINLSLFPTERSFPSLPLRLSGPSLPPSLHLSVSDGEKMEHGNYGNCIRQVLGSILAAEAFLMERWNMAAVCVHFIITQCLYAQKVFHFHTLSVVVFVTCQRDCA